MANFGETDKMHNIVYILIVLISCTFADVAFVTKPPEKVRTFPGQHVTLPCVLKNLTDQLVRWLLIKNSSNEYITISNRNVIKETKHENAGENFSITGDGMNFTLLFNIPDKINFGSNLNVTTSYRCYVNKQNINVAISANSTVIIHRFCETIKTYYVIGDILTLQCYNDSDAATITTLKSGNGSVLPTYLDKTTSYIMQNLTLTKEDHNVVFVCELRRNGTNEIRNCSMGPITVNYKPEIKITQKSPMEFHCTAEARPPVNKTHWITEPSIPQDSFTILNGVLTITKPLKVESKIKVTCEAENSIGKGNKSLTIPTVNNRDEEDGFDSTLVVIVVICVLFCVVIASIIIFLFLRRKRIKHQQTPKSRNMSARFKRDDPQVKIKNEDPKRLVYDYATIDVNEFCTDYQETKNEIYVGGDTLNSDESNVANKKQSNTVNIAQLKYGLQNYSQVNKPDNKECENEIYQGAE